MVTHDQPAATRLEEAIESRLPLGVKVQMTMPTSVFKQAIVDHLQIIRQPVVEGLKNE